LAITPLLEARNMMRKQKAALDRQLVTAWSLPPIISVRPWAPNFDSAQINAAIKEPQKLGPG
jgi:hypothetical protein